MASRGVNKAIIVGNLGNDPETRHAADGRAICTISVATSEHWNDKTTGEKVEKTEWHRCVAFGPLAEIMDKYLRKGSRVYLEGGIHTRKWQDDNGTDRYSTEIKIKEMQMLGDHNSAGAAKTAGSFRDNPQQAAAASPQAAAPAPAQQAEAFAEDDIPF